MKIRTLFRIAIRPVIKALIRPVILLTLLTLSSAAFAHRLNEYLVATTINLSGNKVQLEVRLTPGVAVAADVLKDIDRNNDHQLSPAEQQAYVTRLAHDLSFTLDGRSMLLQPVAFTFPTVEAIKLGIGDIIVEFEAAIFPTEPSSHHLEIKNTHEPTIAVYLVSCLLPVNAGIHVDHQTRNADQSDYQLDFTISKLSLKALSNTGAAISQAPSMINSERLSVMTTYFVHGIRHILTGYDHLLFLCALVLGAAGLWDLIKIVTAFTIAHSITLTLATFGLAHLPSYIVEPMISLSIVFIAIQNIFYPRQSGGGARLAAAFFFGLFHGLGFAGGLLALMHAMPPRLVIAAILGFSLGVEVGNQLVLLPLFGLLKGVRWWKASPANPGDPANSGDPTNPGDPGDPANPANPATPANLLRKKQRFTLQQLASGVVAVAGLYYLCVAL